MKRPQTFSGRNASQNSFELQGFISLLKSRKVTSYLEIGARHGDTFHAVMTSLPEGSAGLAVDLPGGLWGKLSTAQSLKNATADLKSRGYKAKALFGNSQDAALIQKIKESGPFDAILIDGDHTLEGVTKDWENYKDAGSLIAFHDIVGTGQFEKVYNNPVEVPILWAELKQKYDHLEFIDDKSAMGIGCILLS